MPLQQLRNVNFGRSKSNATGSLGVGYSILDISGSVVSPRTTTGVYQLESGSGIYAAYVEFPDHFRGQILWDTGTFFASKSYAAEQANVEENNPRIDDIDRRTLQMSGTLGQLYDIQYGRWRIVSNQMVFYKEDNATEVARFNLFDDAGAPSMDAVFDRQKVLWVLTGSSLVGWVLPVEQLVVLGWSRADSVV